MSLLSFTKKITQRDQKKAKQPAQTKKSATKKKTAEKAAKAQKHTTKAKPESFHRVALKK